VGNALAKDRFLGRDLVGVKPVEVTRQTAKVHNVSLSDGATGGICNVPGREVFPQQASLNHASAP
jgi:hypothetical protein